MFFEINLEELFVKIVLHLFAVLHANMEQDTRTIIHSFVGAFFVCNNIFYGNVPYNMSFKKVAILWAVGVKNSIVLPPEA